MNMFRQQFVVFFISIVLIASGKNVDLGKIPLIEEAESGTPGSEFSIQLDGDVTYVITDANYTGSAGPGEASRIITY